VFVVAWAERRGLVSWAWSLVVRMELAWVVGMGRVVRGMVVVVVE
jgi:membrane-anchored protein YejM (alkaline phosphatase superfamily)